MLRELVSKLQSLSKGHQSNLDLLLKEHNLTQSEITGKMMKGEELPYAIAKEVFYLDANNRIINLLNFTSKDMADWELKDYVKSLFEKTIDWTETEPELLAKIRHSGKLDEMHHVDDNVLIPSVVLASIKRHEERQIDSPPNPEAA